jgi:hypothetical protein
LARVLVAVVVLVAFVDRAALVAVVARPAVVGLLRLV